MAGPRFVQLDVTDEEPVHKAVAGSSRVDNAGVAVDWGIEVNSVPW